MSKESAEKHANLVNLIFGEFLICLLNTSLLYLVATLALFIFAVNVLACLVRH